MSTRSTTHFVSELGDKPTAIVYRHSDGYPSGAGKDIQQFLRDVVANTQDTRFYDPSYLAAKYVVWLAGQFARRYERNAATGEYGYVASHPLDFISVGVVQSDPDDIEYRYIIVAAHGADAPGVYVDVLDGKGPRVLSDVLDEEAVTNQ